MCGGNNIFLLDNGVWGKGKEYIVSHHTSIIATTVIVAATTIFIDGLTLSLPSHLHEILIFFHASQTTNYFCDYFQSDYQT